MSFIASTRIKKIEWKKIRLSIVYLANLRVPKLPELRNYEL